MLIQVLGTGCAKCRALHEAVEEAVRKTDVDAQVEKVEDIQKILAFAVLATPALVIDGRVVAVGKALSPAEIKRLLE